MRSQARKVSCQKTADPVAWTLLAEGEGRRHLPEGPSGTLRKAGARRRAPRETGAGVLEPSHKRLPTENDVHGPPGWQQAVPLAAAGPTD